ncbi:polynucleotide 5'-triphosphatase, partial [Phenoliferia sp. Uapishka_3]
MPLSSILNDDVTPAGTDVFDYFSSSADDDNFNDSTDNHLNFNPQPTPTPTSTAPPPSPPLPLQTPLSSDSIPSKKRPRSRSPTPVPSPAPHLRPTSSTSSSAPPPPLQNAAPMPFEPSIFNVEPIDEFTREVADWLWGFASQEDWNVVEVSQQPPSCRVEQLSVNGVKGADEVWLGQIEAKIGLLVNGSGKQRTRVSLPVPIETILADDTGVRFESNMTINQHQGFNLLLNSRVEESASPSYPFAPIRYAHVRECDSFHSIAGRKLRVTTDQKDGKELRVVEKMRVADMNVLSPKRGFDFRISVNTEVPVQSPPSDSTPNMIRKKDRISYSHQLFQVDLTQVTQGSGGPVMHELEIEFKNARLLLTEARKETQGQENRYLEMVQCFLNNIRMLIRNAPDP